MHILALRGWHPQLARAEVEALGASGIAEIGATRIVTCESYRDDILEAAGLESILQDGIIISPENLSEVENWLYPREGKTAVRVWRHEGRLDISSRKIAKYIGGLLTESNVQIDLESPEHRIGVILDASSGKIAIGWMQGVGPKGDDITHRQPTDRPFFKPVSLDSRLARTMVNLVRPTDGFLVDPMCGTGGILVEASLMGIPAIGMDLDLEMVEGARENVKWVEGASEIILGNATDLSKMENITTMACDPPYGRNSWKSEDAPSLVEKVIASAIENGVGKFALIIPCQPSEVEQPIEIKGLDVTNQWVIPVHASLSRILVLAQA